MRKISSIRDDLKHTEAEHRNYRCHIGKPLMSIYYSENECTLLPSLDTDPTEMHTGVSPKQLH